MSENKYQFKGSPAPWVIDDANDISSSTPINGDIVCLQPEQWELSMRYWEANSHLISSAPDLLQACINMLNCIEADTINQEIGLNVQSETRSAIHKALNIID